jgi:hypothetical protein
MERVLRIAVVGSLLVLQPSFAQDKKTGSTPPKAPEAKAAATAPAGNAPAGTDASTTPAATKNITVRVPSGGDYTAYIQEAKSAAPKKIADTGELEVPAGLATYTVYVLDMKSGYAGRKSVDAKSAPTEISFASPDFNLVQKVRVLATGKDGKPIAQGNVTLTDSGNNTSRGFIQAASEGVAEFSFVKSGMGSVEVTSGEGTDQTSIKKNVSLDLPKGETAQTVTIPMPEVTNVVESAAGTEPAEDPKTGEAAGTTEEPAKTEPSPAPAPAAPTTPETRVQPGFMDQIGSFVIGLIQFAILVALIVFGFNYLKKRGVTVETLLKKMGIQPETAVVGGGSLAGANLAGGSVAPGVPPPPPPVVDDPNKCQFCGMMKDPSGGCACAVGPGSVAGGAAFGGGASSTGSGPRLVGMAGAYMGQVFPISGTAIIGRDAMNPIPLDRDTTTSRRHAQITAMGGSFQLQDLGSSNGTYVNGARVTETTLSPGDEVAIGGTRFRFEV